MLKLTINIDTSMLEITWITEWKILINVIDIGKMIQNLKKKKKYPFSNIDPIYIRMDKAKIKEKQRKELLYELKKCPTIQ